MPHPLDRALPPNASVATINETCRALNRSRPFIYKLMKEGKIRSRKFGYNNLIEIDSIYEYFDSLPTDPSEIIKPRRGRNPDQLVGEAVVRG